MQKNQYILLICITADLLWAPPPARTRVAKRSTTAGENGVNVHASIQTPAQFLVESTCLIKHTLHVCHSGCVPIGKILVETNCILKHSPHVCHGTGVPTGKVFVESNCFIKHGVHACHGTCVPIGKVPGFHCRQAERRLSAYLSLVVKDCLRDFR
jgi:hypothetical protein